MDKDEPVDDHHDREANAEEAVANRIADWKSDFPEFLFNDGGGFTLTDFGFKEDFEDKSLSGFSDLEPVASPGLSTPDSDHHVYTVSARFTCTLSGIDPQTSKYFKRQIGIDVTYDVQFAGYDIQDLSPSEVTLFDPLGQLPPEHSSCFR